MREMAEPSPPDLIALLGPTGSGKSELAARLAARLGGEVVNCDAFQMYAGLAVGTAQPGPELRARAPHHGYGWLSPEERLSAGEYARRAEGWIADVRARGRRVILCGGTGFYFEALTRPLPATPPRDPALDARLERLAARHAGRADFLHRVLRRLDPAAAAGLAPRDGARIRRALEYRLHSGERFSGLKQSRSERPLRHPYLAFGVDVAREALAPRLEARARAMLAGGLLEEAAALQAEFPDGAPGGRAIGYAEAAAVLDGRMNREAAAALITRRSLQYAKRQRTWLRKTPGIKWLENGVDFTIEMLIATMLQTVTERPAGEPPAPGRGG